MHQPSSSTGQPAYQLIESRGIVQVFTAALTWLIGLAAMWLLWRARKDMGMNEGGG